MSMQYKLIFERTSQLYKLDILSFADKVNEAISEGWIPIGGVSITGTNGDYYSNTAFIMQAVIKED